MRFLQSFFSLALCLMVSVVYAQVNLNNGLQAYYPFNGNANDASGFGNNPSVVNATLTTDYYGKANSAYYFDGSSSFIQIPNSSSINFGSTMSVCVWFKTLGFYKGKCHGNRIVMKGFTDNEGSEGNYLLGYSDNVALNGQSCNTDVVDTVQQTAYAAGTGIPPTPGAEITSGVWRSMVWTYDGAYARLYINCDLVIETYAPGSSFTNAYDLFLGKMNNDQYPYYFNGVLDEVRIYNRALNTDEIRAYSFSCNGDAGNSSLCTGSLGDPIVNINFGKGNNPGSPLSTIVPGASTTYNFVSVTGNPANPVPVDGNYTITNNIPANNNWFQGAADHTGNGNGYMAFFNASPVPGEFYKQTVSNLCPNTSYQFAAWLANALDPSVMPGGIQPDVTFRIEKTDGTLIASYKTGGIPQTSTMTWKQYGFFFATPADVSTVVLKMINTNVGGSAQPGNDFALDDITFRACGADASASFKPGGDIQSSLTVAPSAAFTLYGTVYPAGTDYDYLWQSSTDGGVTWKDVANSNKISITQTAPATPSAIILYRLLNAKKGNIGSANCRVTSNTVTLNVTSSPSNNTPCNSWLKVNGAGGGVTLGDIDVTGRTITVEATFNSMATNGSDRTLAGDLVSKHSMPTTTNYLLRPNSAEITTSNGYFITPVICNVDLNKTYHAAMVYDGSTLKFYRDGFLMSQIACTGDMYQNDFITTIGAYAPIPQNIPDESFRGYINEVRIWNVARTQNEIKQYMNQSLPNPQGQTGLVAYYTFDNVVNKQGNPQWNGTLINGATINQANPTCAAFTPDSCNYVPPVPIVPTFNAPDTVCVNAPFTVTNTTTGATTNHWNFCQPNLTDKPAITNLGNLGGGLYGPVYSEYVQVNGNYYLFVVNNYAPTIWRYDFGNSLLNTPTAVSLNNVDAALGKNSEGIQIIQNNGRWYAIIVGGDPNEGVASRIVKLDFGTSITNASPAVTNWGNPGNLLSYPHDLYMFREGGKWYGYTANTYANNIVKFDFGTDFSATPAASVFFTSFMNYPAGLYAHSQNAKQYLFIVNAGTSNVTSTLVRLDFGSSYNSTPTASNLGSLGGNLGTYDFTTVATCNQLIGMANRINDNVIARFTFPNADITQTPVFLDTIASGQLNFPHSFSTIFHEGSDSYFFIPNASNSTLARLKIAGCTSASPAGSNSTNPGTIAYNTPGTYTISLTADEGLQTQATTCKSIIVLPIPKPAPPKDTSYCEGTSLRLLAPSTGKYIWNTGSTDSAITVSQPGKYWVQISNGSGCGIIDSFNVASKANPVVNLGKDTGICKNGTFVLNAGNAGSTYVWQDGSTKQTYTATKDGTYYVTVTNTGKCSKTDTVKIADYPSPVLTGLSDSKICLGNSAQLSVTANGTGNTYSWSPASTLSSSTVANPTAKPSDTTSYTVTVINATGCITKDTATVFVLAKPVVTSIADTGLCTGNSVTLQTTTSNTTNFSWSPGTGLDNAAALSPKATPASTTSYIATAKNDGCSVSDTVKLTVYALPSVVASNDTAVCGTTSVQLSATGGSQYKWSPATGLSNANIANPVASVNATITYTVTGTDNNGCANKDSVRITNRALTQFAATTTTPVVCAGDSVVLKASGGDTYNWQPSESVLRPSDSVTYARPTASTTYSVQITNQQCKTSGTKEVAVTVNLRPEITIAKSNDIDCRQKEATLTVSGAASYTWSPAVTDSMSGMSVVRVAPEETTVYKVTAISDKGCVSTDTVTVKVNINLENQYPIQNAFSPNGDGINDCFGIKAWDVLKVDFEIFDRWGVLLFHSTDPQNVCWDGRYKNKNQLDGTYIYKIYAVTACGIINKAGPFVLIRAAR